MKAKQANVHFNPTGTPVADDFDDVYFSNDSGLDETLHVFIKGNDLPLRWQAHTEAHFVIAETGFGTGLNCLVAMRAFDAFRQANPDHVLKHLYILTTEKFPLPYTALVQALNAFPALADYAHALTARYPMALEGCHRLQFDEFHTTLDLWIGDVHALLPQWHAPLSGMVDAWFLDGFAPSKNPDMWTEALFSQMARLSKAGTTLATFTAAGIVKRGLAEAGFTISKRPGFGRKRDMVTGIYTGETQGRVTDGPYYRFNTPALAPGNKVVVVGGGIAAATITLALAERGLRVDAVCKDDTLATGASGNPQGGFYPQLHAQANHPSQLQAHSFLYARRTYDALAGEHAYTHDFCGVLQLGFTDDVAARQQNQVDKDIWPQELITPVTPEQTHEIAGIELPYPGLFIPQGGWVNPPELVNALFNRAIATDNVTVHLNSQLNAVEEQESGVVAHLDNGTIIEATHIVLCPGHHALNMDVLKGIPFKAVRGQVEALPEQAPLNDLKTVLCHKGYATPYWQGRMALGSTYVKDDTDCTPRAQESQQNLNTHAKALGKCDWAQSLEHDGQARAAIRLGVPDHQPVAGRVPNVESQKQAYEGLAKGKPLTAMPTVSARNVSVFTALGSRGLTTAPLLAEMLASELCHQPLPLPQHLLQALAPNRFLVRDSIRGVGV